MSRKPLTSDELESGYIFRDISLYHVRNRNELRVIEYMESILSEYPDYEPNEVDIEDIYALAVSSLPVRYIQAKTLIQEEPTTEAMVENAIRQAIERVRKAPHY